MRTKNLYRSINFGHLLRRFVLLFLVAYITAIPGFKYAFDQANINFEQCEVWGEEDLKEKEIIADDVEDIDQIFYGPKRHAFTYFNNFITEFNLDIRLPPPKIV